MSKEDCWQRALQIASMLPNNPKDAREILRCVQKVIDYIDRDCQKQPSILSIVREPPA
jgi:hypothetical protein